MSLLVKYLLAVEGPLREHIWEGLGPWDSCRNDDLSVWHVRCVCLCVREREREREMEGVLAEKNLIQLCHSLSFY